MAAAELEQLNLAQQLVEEDPSQYPQIVQGILPFTDRPDIQIRQWCASFLLDAFTSRAIEPEVRSVLAVVCLDPILKMLDMGGDWHLMKNLVACSATLYSQLFRYVAERDDENEVWEKTLQLKTKILKIWNDENCHFGVESCCIKFAQQLISCQSYGGSRSGTSASSVMSLSDVPDGHPLIDSTLEAQALGLLDRLLYTFQESRIFAPRIIATINALSPLIRSRPSTVNKILRSILAFDSSTKNVMPRASNSRAELEYKFIDRSLHLFLDSVIELDIAPKYNPQIKKFLSTLSQMRASERLRKRIDQSEDATPVAKRQRLTEAHVPPNTTTTMPPGPCSYTTLFNLLRSDDQLASFDAKELPSEIAINIAMIGISRVNPELLKNSIGIVNQRYKNLVDQSQFEKPTDSSYFSVESYGDDLDEKNFETVEAAGEPRDAYDDDDDEVNDLMSSASFSLPPPSALSEKEKLFQVGKVVERLASYSGLTSNIVSSGAADANKGINRVAISDWNADTWIVIASRTITRGMCGDSPLADVVRTHIFNYAMENFRDRLEVIVTWLTEEWFSEQDKDVKQEDSAYFKWTKKLLDQIVPLIDKNDTKGWLRLLSDLPELDKSMIWNIRSLCIDPDRSQLGFMSLRYLLMFKPPCKPYCLELLEYLYDNDESSKQSAETLLKKFRK